MKPRVSLIARAVLALGGTIGFYILATAIACGFFWLATQDSILGSLIPGASLIFVVPGIGILWALVPRVDRFEAPGLRVTAADEPALFELVATVAAATRQRMPDEVYVVNDVTASVTQRGGMLGVGSRRIMVLGLPLMQLLTVEELKAVVAHEFGHFHAGDVRRFENCAPEARPTAHTWPHSLHLSSRRDICRPSWRGLCDSCAPDRSSSGCGAR